MNLKHNLYRDTEHPFAPYLRILGKGRKGSRSLTQEEAREAMGMILRGEVEEVQLGAFLMLLRVKEESPAELAGMVQAARETQTRPYDFPVADLDWSSYAGKRRHYPWFLFAVRLLVDHGVRVFMHGAEGHTINRLYTEQLLPLVGLNRTANWTEAATSLNDNRFAYLPLQVISPVLGDIIQLRNILGLRSPVHTLARLLNPTHAPAILQAIFHPAYRDSHQQAASLLGYRQAYVFKGEGGEIERNPDGLCLIKMIRDGQLMEEEWSMIFPQRHAQEETFAIDQWLAVWRGEAHHEYGEGAVIGTLAIALHLLNQAPNAENAHELARDWWESRDKKALPATPEIAG